LDPHDPNGSLGISGMATDWTDAQDRKPGSNFLREQPEKSGRGPIWTWVISFRSAYLKPHEPDVLCYQQFQIRDCSGQYITTQGRIYTPPRKEEEEDGA
jgi:hypothetical protein